MEEFGRDAFAATMYIKRSGRQLLECVRKPHSVQDLYAVAVKKNGNDLGSFTMAKVVKSVFVLLVTRGHDILYSDWGRRYSVDLYTALLTILCAKVHVIFLP